MRSCSRTDDVLEGVYFKGYGRDNQVACGLGKIFDEGNTDHGKSGIITELFNKHCFTLKRTGRPGF